MKCHFILFSNCFPVKGISRSIICDTQREEYYFIPNVLVDIINNLKKDNIENVFNHYKHQGLTQERFNEYLDFLKSNHLGFYTDSPEEFPEIDMSIEEPNLIEDAIIEWSNFINKEKKNIIELLFQTGCNQLEIRCFDLFDLSEIKDFLAQISFKTKLRNCEIILPYKNNNTKEYQSILDEFPIIGKMYLYKARQNKIKQERLIYLKQNISSSSCCGNVGNNFTINLYSFIESKKYNPCLNRKFTITSNGDIKNCPSLSEVFCNIIDGCENIINIIKEKKFQELWFVSKDDIEICRFCEFRYICGDCRAFVYNKTDKPKKCNYNPKLMKYE